MSRLALTLGWMDVRPNTSVITLGAPGLVLRIGAEPESRPGIDIVTRCSGNRHFRERRRLSRNREASIFPVDLFSGSRWDWSRS